ncbi:MAG TPA: CopD family protein [Steroidobacteraceae bacterium]|jgi:putative copper export protein|nr:CopD family protein [Steroidobacteraceae bacterium]
MIEGIWLVLRAAGLVLSLQAAGAALFSALFGRHALAHSACAIHRVGRRAALAAVALLAAQAAFEPVHLAGEASGLADATLWRLFLSSSAAAALLVRIAGLACVALAWRLSAPGSWALALAGSLATVSSFLLTGHTSVHPARPWLASLLFVHLAIVAFWFGSLWPLRQVTALEPRAQAARAIAAFSALAVWVVPVIALAGAGMAVVLLPDFAALTQPYGLLLLGKIALFALLMGLAAMNRLRLTPALERGAARAPAQLRRSMALEYALIGATLVLTAVMSGSFSPTERGQAGG